jgi:pimeloyl-ACP methyl ester carboxylesterase
MPNVFKAATIEKLRHVEELPAYEHQWNISKSGVLSIHGKRDRIVPYENSLFLQSLFDPQKFSLITLEKGNHTLIWTNFDLIEAALVKSLEE